MLSFKDLILTGLASLWFKPLTHLSIYLSILTIYYLYRLKFNIKFNNKRFVS